MTHAILVCGEALFDFFGDETADGYGFDARVGGSPFNVAVGLARLGAASAFFTGLSTDFLGEKLAAKLAEEGVDIARCVRSAKPTTTAFVKVGADGSPEYAFYGNGAADRSLTGADMPDLAGVAGVHFGSFSMVAGSSADLFAEIMARSTGERLVSVDPNIRPTVEPDMGVWRDRLAHAARAADIVKISDEDAGLIHPGEGLDDVARRFLDAGARLVCVTRGGDGALAYGPDFRLEAPGRKVDVVDTVGAGDTFQAALLAGLSARGLMRAAPVIDRETARALVDEAIRAAAITVSRRGADLPRRAELEG